MRRVNRSKVLSQLVLITALVLGFLSAATLTDLSAAWAQEDKTAAKNAPADDEELTLEKPVAKPVADEAAGEAASDPAQRPNPKEQRLLEWLYMSLGLRYTAAFLFISFTGVALLVMHLISVRRDAFVPPALVQGFESLLNEKKYQEAYDLAKSDESMLGMVLSAGLANLSRGYGPAIEAMQEVGEEENMRYEHRLSYIALVATVSPMVGLLGTVDGMIASFNVIAGSTVSPPPCDLAQGISTALVTTLIGLMIAIPALAVHAIFRNLIARYVLQVGIVSENLMNRFSNVGDKKI